MAPANIAPRPAPAACPPDEVAGGAGASPVGGGGGGGATREVGGGGGGATREVGGGGGGAPVVGGGGGGGSSPTVRPEVTSDGTFNAGGPRNIHIVKRISGLFYQDTCCCS